MHAKSVVIANIIEFNRQAMSRGFTDAEYERWHMGGADLADMALFWCGDDKLVITPYPPLGIFLDDVRESLDYSNVQVVSPAKASDSICEDIVSDPNLLRLLIDTLRGSPTPQIVAWGATKEFYALLDRLREEGVEPPAPEVPTRSDFWTVLYLDSKSGFREFCQKLRKRLPEIHLPEGFICSNKELATEAVSYFYSQRKEFVLKANRGTGGFSMLCYREPKLRRGLPWLQKDIARRMFFDHYWVNQPVILEEYIPGPDAGTPLASTVDFLITQSGEVIFIDAGTMVMRNLHMYAGVQCGLDSVEPFIRDYMVRIGKSVGNAMSALGYRGWFDIDFVVDNQKRTYLTEINARRSCPIHAFEIGRQLLGKDWSGECGLYAKDYLYLQGSCHPDYRAIRQVIEEFNRSQGDGMTRAISTIASSSLSRKLPYLGYAVVSSTSPQAAEAAVELEQLIRKSIGMDTREIRIDS